MADFIIKNSPTTSPPTPVWRWLTNIASALASTLWVTGKFPVAVGGISNSEILKSCLGLLVHGKNDCNAIDEFRGDAFFTRALDVSTVPSCSNLSQRMDAYAASWFELAQRAQGSMARYRHVREFFSSYLNS